MLLPRCKDLISSSKTFYNFVNSKLIKMKKKFLFWSFVGLLLSYSGLIIIDGILQNGNFDFGIIAFELAGDFSASNKIISEWSGRNVLHLASFSLGFDYLFMLFYVSFLAIWTSILSDRFYTKTAKIIARAVIGIFVIAGVLDGIENFALLMLLGNNLGEAWPEIAFYCASVKFGLIGLGIIYNLTVSISKLFKS